MDYIATGNDLVRRGRKAKIHDLEVYFEKRDYFDVGVREGKVETLNQSSSEGMGLRMLKDGRMSFVDLCTLEERNINSAFDKALELLRFSDVDSWRILADPPENRTPLSLDIYDSSIDEIPVKRKIARALQAERTALKSHPLITQSAGSSYTDSKTTIALVSSRGISNSFISTSFSSGVTVIAEKGEQKQEGSSRSAGRFFADLLSPEKIGEEAGSKAALLVGGVPVPTCRVPVIFHPDAAGSLLWALSAAIDGEAVLQNRSFFKGRLGQRVASEYVTVVDDGLMKKRTGSRPFDGEGIPNSNKIVIDRGMLKMFLYDVKTAHRAGTVSTGNAVRNARSLPHIGHMNFYLRAGKTKCDALVNETGKGLHVYRTLGFGVDVVRGTYSVGAIGRWIENGRYTRTVGRVTIAATLDEILNGIDAVCDDLEFRGTMASPTFRVKEMTVAGI
jgi:PmbA protein